MKKEGSRRKQILFSVLMMFVVMLTISNKASALPGGILQGMTGNIAKYKGEYVSSTTNITDNDMDTLSMLDWNGSNLGSQVIFKLPAYAKITGFQVNYKSYSGDWHPNIEFYKQGVRIKIIGAPDIKGGIKTTIPDVKDVDEVRFANKGGGTGYIAEFDVFGELDVLRPQNVKAVPDTREIHVTWDDIADSKLLGYIVYVDSVPVSDLLIDASYAITGLKPDERINIQVVAKYEGDVLSQLSDSVYSAAYADPAANELTAAATHNQVALHWKEIPGARYKLFEGMQLLNESTNTAYTHRGLTPETEYVYTLETTDKYGRVTSTTKTVRTTKEQPPEAPRLTAEIGYNSATLHIDHPGGVKGYLVYQDGEALPDLVSAKTVLLNDLIGGKEYSFHVTAWSDSGLESAASNQIRVTPANVEPPVAPILSVTPGDRSAILNIQVPAQRLLAGTTTQYRVYQDGKALAGLHSTNRIVVNGLKNDTEYAFHVVAIGAYGLESEASNTVTVKPEGKPLPGTGIDSGTIEWGMTPGDILESGGSVVLMLSSFILLGIVVMYVPRLIKLLKTAVKP